MDWTGIIERATYDNARQMVYGGPLTKPQLLVKLDGYIKNPERAMYDALRDSLLTRRPGLR